MSEAVQLYWGTKEIWSMDHILPVFLVVLVRAQVPSLGSEIRFMNDFIAMEEVCGESRVLLTTLQASYCQLQWEVSAPTNDI
eukprot:m.280682 g.280682  ORF g.280682 m.280682 type:complete len:82 (-) comp16325_c0_seq42:1993-2238(-)